MIHSFSANQFLLLHAWRPKLWSKISKNKDSEIRTWEKNLTVNLDQESLRYRPSSLKTRAYSSVDRDFGHRPLEVPWRCLQFWTSDWNDTAVTKATPEPGWGVTNLSSELDHSQTSNRKQKRWGSCCCRQQCCCFCWRGCSGATSTIQCRQISRNPGSTTSTLVWLRLSAMWWVPVYLTMVNAELQGVKGWQGHTISCFWVKWLISMTFFPSLAFYRHVWSSVAFSVSTKQINLRKSPCRLYRFCYHPCRVRKGNRARLKWSW